jgi:DHA2 family multidrug resistance protein
MVRIAPGEAGAALGLFNMMCTHGGATGTAAIESFFPEREQFHSLIVDSHVSPLQSATRDRLAELEQYFMMCRFPDPTEHGVALPSPLATRSRPSR